MVKIGICIAEEVRQGFIELLREFKDVFAWSYQDMPGLNTDIVVHRLPIKEDCKSVQQKLQRMRPNVVLKINKGVQKQFNAGFLQVVKYSEWVVNIVLVSKKDGKYMMESTALNERMARWQILLSEFDIVYVNQKAIKGSVIAEFLASRALEDYETLNFDFPNEDLMYVATAKEDSHKNHHWKLNFDGASNAVGNGIGAVPMFPNGDHYPFTSKLDFDCTNNMTEYETCIMGISAAIERKIKILEVYEDSVLVTYQLKGEWETRDPKLIRYCKLVLELIEEFDSITFHYLPRDENQMVDALATLASMIKVNKSEDMKPIQISIYGTPAP
ncbi:uncharacterized protein LOC128034794 [Gossypium raimondii]|uniref:uncharacterized protein LOC128034794 n=1 Tax=Gossypium raimondii TaxID=29730 RepID=UPI00227A030A|nr:uncharacterized protein LOC128034794 [Gossypium raimondii]